MRRRVGVQGYLGVGLCAVLTVGSASGAVAASRPEPSAGTIACRVLEAHTSERDRVTVVVFHQRAAADRVQLGVVIRNHNSATVTFEGADGKPHSAMLFRLKSCFGRGLLLFPASSAHLRDGEEFRLEIPSSQ